jgi:phosphoserine phosphatase RsbU/P
MQAETQINQTAETGAISGPVRWLHLIGAICTMGLCLFAAIDAGKIKPNDGTVWLLGRQQVTVVEVPTRALADGNQLEPGDIILGIGNTLVESPHDAAEILSRQTAGTTVAYLIQRGEDVFRVPVLLSEFRTMDRYYWYYGLLALAYWVIGLLIYIKGSQHQSARLFFQLCLLFAIFFMTNLNRSSYFWGDIITQNAGALARFFLPALFLHFFLIFPEKKHIITRNPILEGLLYILPLVFYVQFTIDQFFGSHAPRIYNTRWLILGSYFSAGVIAMLHSYLRNPDPLQRQRLRILTLGTSLGIIPFLFFTVLLAGRGNDTLAFIGTAPMIVLPLSFSYCIARYRVIQIEVLLRRSLIYSGLTIFTLIVYLLLALGLGTLLLTITGQTSQLATIIATLIAAASLWPVRTYIQAQLDQKFFRSRSNLAVAMQEISQDIPRIIQQDHLITKVGTQMCKLLDIPKLAVYKRGYESAGTWDLLGAAFNTPDELSGVTDYGKLPDCPMELMLDATTRRMEQFSEPYWIESNTTDVVVKNATTREQAELQQRLQERNNLTRAGIRLLVPMLVHGKLVGTMALPDKRGGDSYQLQDLELLTMVAGQVALQMENSRLYEAELVKQKLDEQLTLARSIQSRLLPGHIPDVDGLDLAACNITSAEVSGDYYDVIELGDGRLAIIISDVSGKGIPASLLASSLQACLRAHCENLSSPSEILLRVNRYLHESTDPAHFATLFLAIYDPLTRTMRYCSGGHNPPILRRADGGISLLEKGGLPIGAFDFGTYDEEEVTLAPGDLLFMYTDGLTETVNHEDEEYGTDRVEAALGEKHKLSADNLIEHMRADLINFSGRTQADDDVTLIAMKINQSKPGNPSAATP